MFQVSEVKNVRAEGFRGDAFERLVPRGRYRWFPRLGNAHIATGERGVEIADPFSSRILLEEALEYAKRNRRVIFFCACEFPCPCHRQSRRFSSEGRPRRCVSSGCWVAAQDRTARHTPDAGVSDRCRRSGLHLLPGTLPILPAASSRASTGSNCQDLTALHARAILVAASDQLHDWDEQGDPANPALGQRGLARLPFRRTA